VQVLRRLYRYRELLYMLARRDFTVRYKQTALGLLWALFTPLAVVLAGIVIRYIAADRAHLGQFDLASIVVKSLPWTFFTGALRSSMTSLVGNGNLVAKMAFPKEVFPFSTIAARLTDFTVATAFAMLVLVFFMDVRFTATAWLAIPLFLVVVMLVTGFALLLSSMNLLYRDVHYVVDVVLTFSIFFTPVLYDVEMLGKYSTIALLNPMAPLLEAFRDVMVLDRLPDPFWTTYSCVFALGIFLLGYRVFKQLETVFAERI
jgi:ABC-type polysaccharide/polyol phosphate export permease